MSQEGVQQLVQEVEMLEALFVELNRQESSLMSALYESDLAIKAITSLKLKPDSETLVEIGNGTYVRGRISLDDKVLLRIGAGIAVDKDADSALLHLETRIKSIQANLGRINAQKRDTELRLAQRKEQASRLMQHAQQSGSQNV